MSPSSNTSARPAGPGGTLAELRMRIIGHLLPKYNGPVASLVESAKMVENYVLGKPEPAEQAEPDES